MSGGRHFLRKDWLLFDDEELEYDEWQDSAIRVGTRFSAG